MSAAPSLAPTLFVGGTPFASRRDVESNDQEVRSARGRAAEDLAAAFFRLLGYSILGRNLRIAGGEIDLIAAQGDWILFVEVRYRARTAYGLPIETLRGRKARAMIRAARAYLASHRGGRTCWRIDAVTITPEAGGGVRIEHFPDAVPLG